MGLNANIILGGQSPDIVGAMSRGAAAGHQAGQFKQQNALNQFLQERGGDVMSGNQGALNALAGFGTQGLDAAQAMQTQQLGLENTRLGMDSTRQAMSHANANQARLGSDEQRKVAIYAATLTAQERAAEAARIENGVAMGLGAQTPEQWDQIVAKVNPEWVGQFENRESIASGLLGVSEALKTFQDSNDANEPAWRQASPDEAAGYGAQAGQINQETGQFKAFNPPRGMSITSDGRGGFSVQQGVGVANGGNGKSLTVDEGKNTGFLIRAQDAQAVINQFEAQGTDPKGRALAAVPFNLGNIAQSPEYQQYDQAKRDMVNAILRRESGAVISDSEFDNADKQYFPQVGDGPDVIAQKRRNRENAIKGIEVGSGDGVNRIGQSESADFSAVDASQILQMDLSQMSEAELSAYMNRMDELGL